MYHGEKVTRITLLCKTSELFPSVKSRKEDAIMDLVASIFPKYISIEVQNGEVKPNYGTYIQYENCSYGVKQTELV